MKTMNKLIFLIFAVLTVCHPLPAASFLPNDLWVELTGIKLESNATVAQLRVHGLVPHAIYTPCVRLEMHDAPTMLHAQDFIAEADTQNVSVFWPGRPGSLFYSVYGKKKVMQPLTENLFCLTLGAGLAYLLWRSLRG
jgi:hypothetical protein